MWLLDLIFGFFEKVVGSMLRSAPRPRSEETRAIFREAARSRTVDRGERHEVRTIRSDSRQGFGQEATFYLGRKQDGYYFAVHIYPHEENLPVYWHGPYRLCETAERRLDGAYERWERADTAREMEWENRQIATFEREQKKPMERPKLVWDRDRDR